MKTIILLNVAKMTPLTRDVFYVFSFFFIFLGVQFEFNHNRCVHASFKVQYCFKNECCYCFLMWFLLVLLTFITLTCDTKMHYCILEWDSWKLSLELCLYNQVTLITVNLITFIKLPSTPCRFLRIHLFSFCLYLIKDLIGCDWWQNFLWLKRAVAEMVML